MKLFNINGGQYKVVGIKDGRVIFQCVLKKERYDRDNPSYKIKFNSEKGYYVSLPTVKYREHELVPIKDIFQAWRSYQDIKQYYGIVKGKEKEDIFGGI